MQDRNKLFDSLRFILGMSWQMLSDYKNSTLTPIHEFIILEISSAFIKPILLVVIFPILNFTASVGIC